MKMNITEVLYGFSTALDAVEGGLLGATTYHAQRVAYISSLIGRKLGLSEYERLCVAVAAVLHDNGLTQYAQGEIIKGASFEELSVESHLAVHCVLGEKNVKCLPIYDDIKDFILYHHEQANGDGPFGKKPDEIPLASRIIHIADRVDVCLDFSVMTEEKYHEFEAHIRESEGIHYDEEVAEAYLNSVDYSKLKAIEGDGVVPMLFEEIPIKEKDYTDEELFKLADMFSTIIDFKSHFTTRHSRGIAEKARMMGEYYGWDEDTCTKLYFAGAVHDVGKLFVDNELLEKPGKLTAAEFEHIKNHASGTYVVLNSIRGINDITAWASHHHEKLDGSGYPFGLKAEDLNKKERLMCCIDIYQALVESRPYKEGMSHEQTMSILRSQAEKGFVDAEIVEDIDKCFKDWVEPPAE